MAVMSVLAVGRSTVAPMLAVGGLACLLGLAGNLFLLLFVLVSTQPVPPWWSMPPVRLFLIHLTVLEVMYSVAQLTWLIILGHMAVAPVTMATCFLPDNLLSLCETARILLLEFFCVERYMAVKQHPEDRHWMSGVCTVFAWLLAALLVCTQAFYAEDIATASLCHQHRPAGGSRTPFDDAAEQSQQRVQDQEIDLARKALFFRMPVLLQALLVEVMVATSVVKFARRFIAPTTGRHGIRKVSRTYFLTSREYLDNKLSVYDRRGSVDMAGDLQLQYLAAVYLYLYCGLFHLLYLPSFVASGLTSHYGDYNVFSRLPAFSLSPLLPAYLWLCQRSLQRPSKDPCLPLCPSILPAIFPYWY